AGERMLPAAQPRAVAAPAGRALAMKSAPKAALARSSLSPAEKPARPVPAAPAVASDDWEEF
ncbi:MAG TPA: efflux transporter periplasmic adaptor subunit, partial [Burkholderiaceae bacterium]|nr:efflux transporter periplasmic adaptor subunit [Burkholderiaceae bacterium]